MGFFDALRGKKEEEKAGQAQQQKKKEQQAGQPEGKYNEQCALCGNANTEKKWMGQYWHKKCLRNIRKTGRKMI